MKELVTELKEILTMQKVSKHDNFGDNVDAYILGHRDGGCPVATEYQGSQSRCLECPFPECIEELLDRATPKWYERDKIFLDLCYKGISLETIARQFDLSTRTIQRLEKAIRDNELPATLVST